MKNLKFRPLAAIAAALFILLAAGPLPAQKVSFDDVMEIELKNMGPIYQNKMVKGYYMFYKVEKKDRKNNNYKLVVLDENMNKVSEKSMTESKWLNLEEAAYDEKSLMFIFYESHERTLEFRQYDLQGKLLSKKSEELGKRESYLYAQSGQQTGAVGGVQLAPVVGKGFVHYTPQKNKKFGYAIRFFAEEGGKNWKFESDEDSKEIELGMFLGYNETQLLSCVIKRKGAMSKDMDFYIMANDLATGKKLYEKPLEDKKHALQLLNAFPGDNGETIITGLYFDADDKLAKAKSEGLFTGKLDASGNFTKKEFISWEKDVAKKLDVSKSGKIDGGGYVFFHNATRLADGKIYAVGELYGKEASALGIASTILAGAGGGGSNVSVTKIEVRDMIVFEFNPDLTLAAAKIFPKKSSGVEMPSGAAYTSTQQLGYLVQYYGGFDYMYTQLNDDASVLTFCYDDYERSKGKRKHSLGVISRRSGEAEYTKDKVSLSSDASWIRTYPAKPGSVLLVEYFKKDKRLETRIEKFNN